MEAGGVVMAAQRGEAFSRYDENVEGICYPKNE
jgi:hypothetical protein